MDIAHRVRAARFELTAFAAARTCASALCATVVGAGVEDILRTTQHAVARLAGLPEGSPVARSVHRALRGALRPWTSSAAPPGGGILCACFALPRDTIVTAIRDHDVRTVEELRALLPATRGCGTCLPDVAALLRAARA